MFLSDVFCHERKSSQFIVRKNDKKSYVILKNVLIELMKRADDKQSFRITYRHKIWICHLIGSLSIDDIDLPLLAPLSSYSCRGILLLMTESTLFSSKSFRPPSPCIIEKSIYPFIFFCFVAVYDEC